MAKATVATRLAPMPPAKEPAFRAPPGRAVAIGRDGKPMYRQSARHTDNDPFAIPEGIEPPDWVYQWKRYSIYNQVDHTHLSKLARVGKWTAVPAERHDGVFMPHGVTGSIIHDGLILMERPRILHEEAEREEKAAADSAMRRATSQRGLPTPAGAGVSTDTVEARRSTFIRQERATAADIEAMAEIPRGAYDRDTNTID